MTQIKESVIGFRLGDYKSGSNEVVAPFCCRHIPEVMKSFIRVGFTKVFLSYNPNFNQLSFFQEFQTFMKQSKYSAFNVRTSKGSWRQLTLRINEAKEILAIVIFDKQDLSDVKHLILHIILRISTIFINIKG